MKHKAVCLAAVLLIGAGCYCAYRYYRDNVLPEKQIDTAHDTQLELFSQIKPESSLPDGAKSPLEQAEKVNDGVVGWITVDGTHIDYPIAQADDNDFYLHHGFDGELNNELGCPFLDYRCDGDFSGFNSIVYGHHMSKQRMFADIVLFKDPAFLRAHPTGTLTLPDGVETVRFFAYMNVPNTAPAYHAVFVSKAEQAEYLDYIFSEAQFTTGVTAEELKSAEDVRLLLLSTCTYEFTDARGILIGVIEHTQQQGISQ